MAGGSFQTSREIFEHPIWHDVTKFRLFFYIYGQAVFSDGGVRIGDIILHRGQYLRSYRNLSKDLEYIENRQVKSYSISTIKRTIDKLVKENRLIVDDTDLGTLFTVVNYEQYQGFGSFQKQEHETALEQRWNSVGTVAEQSRNNNNKDNKDIKDNKENNTTTNDTKRIMDFWDSNGFGFANTNAKTKILMFLDDGMEADAILRALEIASDANKVSYKYVEKVLLDWSQRGLTTLKLVQAAEVEREKQKQQQQPRKGYNKKPIRTEITPDWFDEDLETKKPDSVDDAELENKKLSIEEKLKAFRGE